MIINKFVFPIKADITFVGGALPQGYLTANDINKDMFYVLSPAVGQTSITARLQNSYQSDEPELVKLVPSSIGIDELVDKNASYYELVKDWNIWQGFLPAKALEYVSYNRAGSIGISFSLQQNMVPNPPEIEGLEYKGEITDTTFSPMENGYYIVKVAEYAFNAEIYHYNDMIVKNVNEIVKRSSIAQVGNTGTVEYKVDPSVYGGDFEELPPSLVDTILQQIGKNTQDIKLINLKFDNYYTKFETYNRDEIDTLLNDIVVENGKGYEPDNVTIVLNDDNKLEVSKNIEIDGGFL